MNVKQVLAFGASNAHDSINAQLARYAASQLSDVEVVTIDLNDFEMPIFSLAREAASGIPEPAQRFKELVRQVDGVLISFAEHNGSYSVAFKNLLDWASRIKEPMWLDKPLCFMATSPGARGGRTVLDAAVSRAPFMGGQVISSFSLPSFGEHFDPELGIKDEPLASELSAALKAFAERL